MISEDFLAKVKEGTNLLELANEWTSMSAAGEGMWQGKCPHPDHLDSTPSFTVYQDNLGHWNWCCYGCNQGKKDKEQGIYGSDCIDFMIWLSDFRGSSHKLTFKEAVEKLAGRIGLKMEEDKYSYVYSENSIRAAACHHSLTDYVREYLYSRGLEDDDIETWNLGYDCQKEGGVFVGRITFPIFDRYHRVIGFSNRRLPNDPDQSRKYKNSKTTPWFQKKKVFYGIDKVTNDSNEIRITEGQMDVILSSKYGVKNVIAPLGSAFTEEHAAIIKKTGMVPVFCMDGDSAGEHGASRAFKILSDIGVYSKVCLLPEGKDMADMANDLKDGLEEYIKTKSMEPWLYRLHGTVEEFDSSLNDLRRKVLPDILSAKEGAVNSQEDLIMFNNFCKERFGIEV